MKRHLMKWLTAVLLYMAAYLRFSLRYIKSQLLVLIKAQYTPEIEKGPSVYGVLVMTYRSHRVSEVYLREYTIDRCPLTKSLHTKKRQVSSTLNILTSCMS